MVGIQEGSDPTTTTQIAASATAAIVQSPPPVTEVTEACWRIPRKVVPSKVAHVPFFRVAPEVQDVGVISIQADGSVVASTEVGTNADAGATIDGSHSADAGATIDHGTVAEKTTTLPPPCDPPIVLTVTLGGRLNHCRITWQHPYIRTNKEKEEEEETNPEKSTNEELQMARHNEHQLR
jgi:hypothetical protein